MATEIKRTRSLRRSGDKLRKWIDRRDVIYFRHIGKNAGTQFASLSRELSTRRRDLRIEVLGHGRKLSSLRSSDRYLFSIRSPITRFRSGFYSRKSKGAPRYLNHWSQHEERAFSDFDHANDLAEALFQPSERGAAALAAMKSLQHAASDQIGWFESVGYFFELHPPMAIIRQEHFVEDFGKFWKALGETGSFELLDDDVSANRRSYTGLPEFSALAVENLERWYAQDFEFYRVCEAWIERDERS